ncbi:helix-turn-helix domain-containing protein [Nocardia abscessus]|uniref:helix-turn-helix domain-containing protein n=1 Tax=Nocardia abscessus TaxID=120957 RepID=UPI003CC809EF
MAGTYSKRTDLLEGLAELGKRVERSGPRKPRAPKSRTTGGPKKQLTPGEAAKIVGKYEAGASMAQLKVEHHMAKRTVAKVLKDAGVTIRPRGGQQRRTKTTVE